MRIHEHGPSVVFALALAVLIASAGYPSRLVASDRGPNLGVHIMRPGSDWRSLMVPGQTITINLGVSNLRGDAPAHDTALTVLLPSGLSLKRSRPAPFRTETAKDGARLTWNLGVLEAGAFPRIFDLDLQAAADLKRGTPLAVEASVSTTDKVVDESNTRSAFVLSVENAAADLIVESNLDGAPFTVDNPLDFTVEVTNLGTISASACALTMTLPPKVTFKWSDPSPSDHSGNRVTWKLGDLTPAQPRTVKVRVVLDSILRAAAYGFAPKLGNLHFTFDASTITNEFNPAHGHLEITRFVEPAGSNVAVSLNVTGTEHPGELPIGKDVTYEIMYGNFGNAPASKVSVSLSLPEGLSLVRADPPVARSTKSQKFGGGVFSWDVGDLAVGQSNVIESRIHVNAVADDGSLAMAAITAAGNDIASKEKTAYSLRYAAKPATNHALAAPSNHLKYLILLIAIIISGILWRSLRVLRRPTPT